MKNVKNDNNIYDIIIKFIVDRRRELGYSQNKIALELGISDQAVSNWERGISFPDISYLSDIAKALDTNVLSLVNGKHEDINLVDDLNFNFERFSSYLTKLRRKLNLKQSELGKILDISSQTISKYENGGFLPSIDILIKYANHFNKSFLNIYYGLDDEELYKQEEQTEENIITDVDSLIDNISDNFENKFKKKYKIINMFFIVLILCFAFILLFNVFVTKCTVTLNLGNGEELKYKVDKGSTFNLPLPPSKEGYDSTWDKHITNITKNTTFNVIYTPKEYTITYVFENNLIESFTQKVLYGNNIELYVPDNLDFIGYKYNNVIFEQDIYNYAHNITLVGEFANYYDVTIVINNNEIINKKVKEGDTIELPTLPVLDGYVTSWYNTNTKIYQNRTFNVIYTPNTYKITYIFENNIIDSFTQEVIYDSVYELYIPNNPDFLGYTYNDQMFNSGKYSYPHDITIIGEFKHFCKVSFVLDDNNILKYTVKEGDSIVFPDLPFKKGYTSSWDNYETLITDDITYNVIYTPNTYKITYDFEDDLISDYVQEVVYNEEYQLYNPQNDIFLNYIYNDKEFGEGVYLYDYDIKVIGKCSTFASVTVVIDFNNVTNYSVKKNTNITLPQIPEKKGYTSHWDNLNTLITENTTFTVIYTPKIYKIKISFEDDIYLPYTVDICYDQEVELSSPEISGYYFVYYTYNGEVFDITKYTYDHDIEIMASYVKEIYSINYDYGIGNSYQNSSYNKYFTIEYLNIKETSLYINEVLNKDELLNYKTISWKDDYGNVYESGKEYLYEFKDDLTLYPVFEYFGDAFEYEIVNQEVVIKKYNITHIQSLIIPDYITINNNRYKVITLEPYSFINVHFDHLFIPSSITRIKKYTFSEFDLPIKHAVNTMFYNGTIEEWFNIDFEEPIVNGVYGYKLNRFDSDGRYTIPETIKVLKKFTLAFNYFYFLNIPNTVESIEDYALYNSTIYYLYGINDVENVGENAFYNAIFLNK